MTDVLGVCGRVLGGAILDCGRPLLLLVCGARRWLDMVWEDVVVDDEIGLTMRLELRCCSFMTRLDVGWLAPANELRPVLGGTYVVIASKDVGGGGSGTPEPVPATPSGW